MYSKLRAHGTKDVSQGVNIGLWPLKFIYTPQVICITDSYHPFHFWPCKLASTLTRFSPDFEGRNVGFFFFPSCNYNLTIGMRVTIVIFFLTLNTSIFKESQVVIFSTKKVSEFVCACAFGCICLWLLATDVSQPQFSSKILSSPYSLLRCSWAG